MLYSNERLINDISQLIEDTDTDYPKSYQKVAKSSINNTILTAIQLRSQHLLNDPLANKSQYTK